MTEPPENVLLLVVDSLRYDRVSAGGDGESLTPFMDSFAGSGIRFERAYATGPWTVPVHGSLFTGLYPAAHGSHRGSESFDRSAEQTLAGALSDRGYRTVGVSANPWITPEFGFDAGFDEFVPFSPDPPFPGEEQAPFDEEFDGLSAAQTMRRLLAWAGRGSSLKRLSNAFWYQFVRRPFVGADRVNDAVLDALRASDGTGTFVFANYMDVHSPHYDYVLPSAIAERGPFSGVAAGARSPVAPKRVSVQSEPERPSRARELYDRSVRRMDEGLRALFARLESEIGLADTLTVIVGDHGECLGEHGYWGHNTFLYDELLRVPLLIGPHDAARTDGLRARSPVSLVDLPRYVAEAAGTSMPERAAGRPNSLYDDTPLFAECSAPRPDVEDDASQQGYRAVVDGDWKLVRNRKTRETELVAADGGRRSEREAEAARERLRDREREQWSGRTARRDRSDRSMSRETENRLSDLGYL